MDQTAGRTKATHWRVTLSLGVMLVVSATSVLACGKSHPQGTGDLGNAPPPTTDACTEAGAARPCHVVVSQDNGFVNCLAGTQTCNGTSWGTCDAGGVMGTAYARTSLDLLPRHVGGQPRSLDPSPGLHVLDDPTPASQAATLCAADACDPYCWGWDDTGVGEPPAVPVQADYTMLPGSARINDTHCNVHAGMGHENECQYDTCCPKDGKACVEFGTSNAGRCGTPSSDSWGNVGANSTGNCAAGPDYTAPPACDDGAGDTHISICNRGGADDTTNTLLVGVGGAGGTGSYSFNTSVGCKINFALITGGLAAGECGDLDMVAGTWNNVPTAAIDCSSLGATPAAIKTALAGDHSVRLNGGGGGASGTFGSTGDNNNKVSECDAANDWSYIHHGICLQNTALPYFAPVASLSPNVNVNPCSAPAAGIAQTDVMKCQYDTCCTAALTCLDWNTAGIIAGGTCDPAGITAALPAIAGNGTSVGNCAANPDFTVALGCNNGGKHDNPDRHFEICNRGGVATTLAAGSTLYLSFGKSNSTVMYPFTTAGGGGYCKVDLGTIQLNPQQCGDLNAVRGEWNGSTTGVDCSNLGGSDHARADFFNGIDRVVRVNAHPNSTGDGDNGVVECDGANNFSYRKVNLNCATGGLPPPTPPTDFTYTGKCQPGYHVRWKWISYKLNGPASDGDVAVTATTQLADPGTGVLGPVSAVHNIVDPPVAPTYTWCDSTHNSPNCPINLGQPFPPAPAAPKLGTDAFGEVLNVSLNYSDKNFFTNFGVAYDCIPYE
jgi:hypothetical protein